MPAILQALMAALEAAGGGDGDDGLLVIGSALAGLLLQGGPLGVDAGGAVPVLPALGDEANRSLIRYCRLHPDTADGATRP